MKLFTIALAIACVAQLGAQNEPSFGSVPLVQDTNAEEVEIQKLTEKELAELKAAKKAFAEAQAKLDAIETAIKQGHGETANGYPGDAVVHCRLTNVEIHGAFAVVTKTSNLCTGIKWFSIR